MRLVTAIVGILLAAESASGGSVLDYIRDYDLNDYAFGVALSNGQYPYIGARNDTIARVQTWVWVTMSQKISWALRTASGQSKWAPRLAGVAGPCTSTGPMLFLTAGF